MGRDVEVKKMGRRQYTLCGKAPRAYSFTQKLWKNKHMPKLAIMQEIVSARSFTVFSCCRSLVGYYGQRSTCIESLERTMTNIAKLFPLLMILIVGCGKGPSARGTIGVSVLTLTN